MVCYQTGCAHKPVWQLKLTYRSGVTGAEPVTLESGTFACWTHRAQLLRCYGGARGATSVQCLLRARGLDPGLSNDTKASLAPVFG